MVSVLGMISLICGILGMCTSCVAIGVIPSVIGVILGVVALAVDSYSDKWAPILGIVCGAIGVTFFSVVLLESINNPKSTETIPSPKTVVESVAETASDIKGNNAETESNTASTEKTQKSVSTPKPTQEPKKDYYGLNETAECNNIYVTMTNYYESYGTDYNRPQNGNVFVIIEFDIVNNSSEDIAVSSLISFEAFADDYAVNLSLGALMENTSQQLDGNVPAGKKMRGAVGYEVPANYKEFEISFQDTWLLGNTYKFGYIK